MREKIQRKIDKLLSLLIIVLFVPLFILIVSRRVQLEELLYGTASVMAEEGVSDEETEQIIGIVAKEINTSASREAILAQCVIARTNLYDARMRGIEEPKALRTDEMKELWGDDFKENYEYLAECVRSTGQQVLLWEGEYIYAAYHAVSAGSTRAMSELYPEAVMPYLQAKGCEQDAVAENYLSVLYWEPEEFLKRCKENFPESTVSAPAEVVIERRDTAGYVTAMKIGTVSYDGEKFREAMGLPSSCFAMAEIDGKVRIVTKGLGHGFGLSQNTAELMAKEGKSYEEILAYFFPGAELAVAPEEK